MIGSLESSRCESFSSTARRSSWTALAGLGCAATASVAATAGLKFLAAIVLAKQVRCSRTDQRLGASGSRSVLIAAYQHGWNRARLGHHQAGRGRNLVGNRNHRVM